jgi:hypothetical protein
MNRLVILLGLLVPSLAGAGVVTLAWDPSGPEVAGYRVYYGVNSRAGSSVYASVIDVGPQTSFSVPNLIVGTTYFFAVTAYNLSGVESDFSEEIAYTPPLRITAVAAADESGTTLTWESQPGMIFRVLVASTLTNPVWVDVSGPILALGPTTSWTHVRTESSTRMFYRLEMVGLAPEVNL